jgi:hypothetical protein
MWLSEIWGQHHKIESANFMRCMDCPCRSLGRMQRLWNTSMTREDYILFLSENSWVWAVEPGWAMEGKLKNNPDSFEMAQVGCTNCYAK